ncbi:unnamed protein product [Prorocentrum cordatum]|uniref:Cyclic nucleotide-binding domain-containing protein n=1 Tax=Prorocentrum cordatum TaxID=2364126 RepID=A0ABN9PA88_9DINO|nr:unnamed protein product [Polarella glacialis]
MQCCADAAALGQCLLDAQAAEGLPEEASEGFHAALSEALAAYSERRAEEGWALLDLIELQAANELRAGALLQGPVVMGFLIEQVARGSLKPLAELGSRMLGARLQKNESFISSELDAVPLLGLLHERVALGTWKRFFDGVARLKPDMQTALMATDEPYSELVNRNTAWLELLQVSRDSFGAQQVQVVRGIEVLRGLPDSTLLDWAAAFTPQERLQGDVIVRQAVSVKSFFAIRSGTCTVLRDGAEVATLGPGDHYGGIALLLGVPSSTSLVASTDAGLLEMPREVFLRLVERQGPELRAALSAPADRFHLGLDGVASEQEKLRGAGCAPCCRAGPSSPPGRRSTSTRPSARSTRRVRSSRWTSERAFDSWSAGPPPWCSEAPRCAA